jgi:L-arabinose isomerase
VLSYDLTAEHMRSFAAVLGIEFVYIGPATDVDALADRLRMDDVIWKMKSPR